MKIGLHEITMKEYVDIVTGDLFPLSKRGVSKEDVHAVRRDLIFQFQEISDSGQARMFLINGRKLEQTKAQLTIYEICRNLLNDEHLEEVREILQAVGVRTAKMSDERIKAEVSSRYAKAKREMNEQAEPDETKAPADIRRSFDRQTAMLMTHFHMPIDTDTIKASVYANLLDRCRMELQAQTSAIKKFKR